MSLPAIFEYLDPEAAAHLVKTAAADSTANKAFRGLKVVGKGLAGFGLGTAAGVGAGALSNKIYQAATGKEIPASMLVPAATLLGAGMGVAYSMYKSTELGELQDAIKDRRDTSSGERHPGK